MPAERPRVIVYGATGKQGGGFVQALLKSPSQPYDIYAVTRDPNSKGAQSLASNKNVFVVKGDFDNPDAVFTQVRNPWGMFLVTALDLSKKHPALLEEEQGKKLVDAALVAGVKHIVFNSVDRGVDSDNKETPIPHFASKKRIEDHLKVQSSSRKTTWTIIRPVAFMDNISNDFIGKLFVAAWRQNGPDTKLHLIGSKDIGRVSADAMLNADTEEYKNKAIAIAGDEISPAEAAVAFKRATGKDIISTFGVLATLAKWAMPDELGKMFTWFKEDGYKADVPALRKRYPFLKSFEQWVAEESAFIKR